MNLSLTNRVKMSFIIANLVVLIMGFLMYFFLGSLSSQAKTAWEKLENIKKIDETVRQNIVDMTAMSLQFSNQEDMSSQAVIKLQKINTELFSGLKRLKFEYDDNETKLVIQAMIQNVKTLTEYLGDVDVKKKDYQIKDLRFYLKMVEKVSKEFSRYNHKAQIYSKDNSTRLQGLIVSVKKNMLMVLILTFLGTIILGWLMPHKVALPFKKINHAIRELQECNFDVSIVYDENDEIGELSRELNKMIAQLKLHEDLRADKFALETKKFSIIANYIHKNILVVNSEGKLTYMNNDLYSILRLESADIIDKDLAGSLIPETIVGVFKKALQRRTKIENEEIQFTYQKLNEDGEEKEVHYTGYAEVYPIRGKESSLDYYLMVINDEMTT